MISITSTPRKVEDVRTTGVPMVMVVLSTERSSLTQQPQTQLPVYKTSTGNLEHRTEHLHIEARQTHERQSRSSLRATCHDQYVLSATSNSHSEQPPIEPSALG